MTEPRQIAECADYFQLHAALRARADDLELTREGLDDVAGWASGYAAKLLCNPNSRRTPGKRAFRALGPMSMGVMLGALGLKIVLVEDPKATAMILSRRTKRQQNDVHACRARTSKMPRGPVEFYMRELARRGGCARRQSLSKRERSLSASRAAKARWRAVRKRSREGKGK